MRNVFFVVQLSAAGVVAQQMSAAICEALFFVCLWCAQQQSAAIRETLFFVCLLSEASLIMIVLLHVISGLQQAL